MRTLIGNSKKPCVIGVVVRIQAFGCAARGFIREMVGTERLVHGSKAGILAGPDARARGGFLFDGAPRPGIAEPQRRQYMNVRRLWTAIGDGEADQNIGRRCLGVLDGDIEVALFGEDPAIEEFKFRLIAPAAAVLIEELLVGIGALRVLVESAAVAVRGSCVLIVVELLHVLAVVALRSGEAE